MFKIAIGLGVVVVVGLCFVLPVRTHLPVAPAVFQEKGITAPPTAIVNKGLTNSFSSNGFAKPPAKQKADQITEPEWVFVTENDELIFGDFLKPIELELKFDYGTAKIPMADIVSFSRLETRVDNEKKDVALAQPQFIPPALPINDQAKTEAKKTDVDIAKSPASSNDFSKEDKADKSADNLIVVATRNGNFLVGHCDMADFHVRTKYGTMTIDQSKVNSISCRSMGLQRIAQPERLGWALVPLDTRQIVIQSFSSQQSMPVRTSSRLELRKKSLR